MLPAFMKAFEKRAKSMGESRNVAIRPAHYGEINEKDQMSKDDTLNHFVGYVLDFGERLNTPVLLALKCTVKI